MHDVASGLLGTPVPLGIIPMGTANVFAREVGVPTSSDRIAGTLMNGREMLGALPVEVRIHPQPLQLILP